LHEIVDGSGAGANRPAGGAATGFSALLCARIHQIHGRAIVWVARRETLYGPALAGFGVPAKALILVRASTTPDILWAMEEALREAAVGAVLGEIDDVDLTASRRLQLAAEAGGAAGLLLRSMVATATASKGRQSPTASVTRWRVTTAASAPARTTSAVGFSRWHVALERCRGGRPYDWLLEFCDATRCLTLAAPLSDRQTLQAQRTAGSSAFALAS
jgi:protein ImuA